MAPVIQDGASASATSLMHHPIVKVDQYLLVRYWGFNPDIFDPSIRSPTLTWLGWNGSFEEYSTIVFTYPVAFIAIIALPIGYTFIGTYYLFTGNFDAAMEQVVKGGSSFV